MTGNEPWVIALNQGAQIWMHEWGEGGKKWWWPIVFVELDCGLIKIDVCGEIQNMDLGDCAELRIENGLIIDNDDIYKLTGE